MAFAALSRHELPATNPARGEGRAIVFIDESGLSTCPHRVRTWAPRGQTPVLQETFNWDKLSLVGGLTLHRLYFRLHEGSIRGAHVASFLCEQATTGSTW